MTADNAFFTRAVNSIRSIPEGKVATYGLIARLAGNGRAARQVAYILSSSWKKHNLPWHRVVNSRGEISLRRAHGYEAQKELLEKEGVVFREDGSLDLGEYLWKPEKSLSDLD